MKGLEINTCLKESSIGRIGIHCRGHFAHTHAHAHTKKKKQRRKRARTGTAVTMPARAHFVLVFFFFVQDAIHNKIHAMTKFNLAS